MNADTTPARRRRGAFRSCLIGLALLATTSVAACTHGTAAQPTSESDHETMAPTASMAPTAPKADERETAWAARPAYTHTTAAAEEAYRYGLDHPGVLRWIPCYCGCGEIGHGSNLDCYYEPRADGSIVFDEHASYCGICVDITLRTRQLTGSGASLATIRAAVDAEFGNGYGTDTPWPSS